MEIRSFSLNLLDFGPLSCLFCKLFFRPLPGRNEPIFFEFLAKWVVLMRLDVFGKEIELVRKHEQWLVFYPGSDGKKRLADDLIVPSELAESELPGYFSDLCHEWAAPGRDTVRPIEPAREPAA